LTLTGFALYNQGLTTGDLIMNKFYDVMGWVGAGFMVAASFNMQYAFGMLFAMIGLFCLTLQAWDNSQNNLILLNSVSFIGFAHSLVAVMS
tara:strand:- start:81 stop:353 length:273 start_codon:yes stop_codon:yes gene_type:complete